MNNIVIVGGGAAGMTAALAAKRADNNVLLLERNENLGKKLRITGKGRCNITNATEPESIIRATVRNGKFLYTALYTYTNDDIVRFLEENGVPTKVERGMRVFPVSDKAADVVAAFSGALKRGGIRVQRNIRVNRLIIRSGRIQGLQTMGGEELAADRVILATGGRSYPSTGSDGSGYRLAEQAGHTIVPTVPVLTGLRASEGAAGTDTVRALSGLSLKNVGLRISVDGKNCYDAFGELLFTHTGISGPMVLTASSVANLSFPCTAVIDFKPALDESALDRRWIRLLASSPERQLRNLMKDLLPNKAIEPVLVRAGANPFAKAHTVDRVRRRALIDVMKNFSIPLAGRGSFREAVVTRGGVDVREVDPYTMASKKVDGLYFAGELLDMDALTGGYNLQIAWSTGYLAGCSAAEKGDGNVQYSD
ncbi:MAG: NAD(P)/FAD-dependent oxidoreductase [Eubacteriales bacterium]|nr:NAD(P)/FAD-dependent oxidoreductase [Eubacteriales bacterium]